MLNETGLTVRCCIAILNPKALRWRWTLSICGVELTEECFKRVRCTTYGVRLRDGGVWTAVPLCAPNMKPVPTVVDCVLWAESAPYCFTYFLRSASDTSPPYTFPAASAVTPSTPRVPL